MAKSRKTKAASAEDAAAAPVHNGESPIFREDVVKWFKEFLRPQRTLTLRHHMLNRLTEAFYDAQQRTILKADMPVKDKAAALREDMGRVKAECTMLVTDIDEAVWQMEQEQTAREDAEAENDAHDPEHEEAQP